MTVENLYLATDVYLATGEGRPGLSDVVRGHRQRQRFMRNCGKHQTLIDLRSDEEYLMDSEKYNSTVWHSYNDMIYTVKKGTHSQKHSR
jgi:hypothetical protein